MSTLRILPASLQRSFAPERMAPSQARTLQHANVLERPGKLKRAKGLAKTQVSGSSTSVTGAGTFENRAGKKLVVDGSRGGVVRITPGDATVLFGGPLPEWNDSSSAET